MLAASGPSVKRFVEHALRAALSRIRRLVQHLLSQAARKRAPTLQGQLGGEEVAGDHDEAFAWNGSDSMRTDCK